MARHTEEALRAMEEVIERARIRDAGVVRGLRYAIWLMANGPGISQRMHGEGENVGLPDKVRDEAKEHRVWIEALMDRTDGLGLDPAQIERGVVEADIDFAIRELLGEPVTPERGMDGREADR